MLQLEKIKAAQNESPAVPHENKSEPWEVIIEVLERRRKLIKIERAKRH